MNIKKFLAEYGKLTRSQMPDYASMYVVLRVSKSTIMSESVKLWIIERFLLDEYETEKALLGV